MQFDVFTCHAIWKWLTVCEYIAQGRQAECQQELTHLLNYVTCMYATHRTTEHGQDNTMNVSTQAPGGAQG